MEFFWLNTQVNGLADGSFFLSNAGRCLQVSRWRIDPFPVPRLELNTEQGTQHHGSTEQGTQHHRSTDREHNIIDKQN